MGLTPTFAEATGKNCLPFCRPISNKVKMYKIECIKKRTWLYIQQQKNSKVVSQRLHFQKLLFSSGCLINFNYWYFKIRKSGSKFNPFQSTATIYGNQSFDLQGTSNGWFLYEMQQSQRPNGFTQGSLWLTEFTLTLVPLVHHHYFHIHLEIVQHTCLHLNL